MPRRFRIVVSGRPHHVIQRGNRRQRVFFTDQDKAIYLKLLNEQTRKHGVDVLAYCLMDNHVHLILVPGSRESLAKAVAETNRRYTCMINGRYEWRGYLWQGRFLSSVMDDHYLIQTLHYVENNPVRAGMVRKAWQYVWSSANAHVNGDNNSFLAELPIAGLIKNWKDFLMQPVAECVLEDIRKRNRAGLPLGEEAFIKDLVKELNISLHDLIPRSVGRPKTKTGTH